MSLPKEALDRVKELLTKSIENSQNAIKLIDDELEVLKGDGEIEQLNLMRKIFSDSIDSDKKVLEKFLK